MTASKDDAERQLDRVLSFFPRVDAKASFLFALDTGLLALLALNLRQDDFRVWFLVVPGYVPGWEFLKLGRRSKCLRV
jgi:hypothetical protein